MPLSGFLQDWQKTLAQNAYALLRQLTSMTQLFLPSAMYVTAIFHGKHLRLMESFCDCLYGTSM